MGRRWKWVVFGLAVGAFAVAERVWPLRRRREPGLERVARNLAIGAAAGVTTAFGAAPALAPIRRWAERRQVGLLRMLALPPVVRVLAGFLLLDYTLYIWHRLNHQLPALWRFHAVHHIDLDLDATTGLRFHFGEMALTAGLRAVQIVALGVDAGTIRVWQRLLFASVLFHHSNVALGEASERRLRVWVVTPQLHGIHHSSRPEEMNTNFSSLLPWWDYLHRSFRADVAQAQITIGVAGHLNEADVTLARSLALPWTGVQGDITSTPNPQNPQH